MKAIVLLLYSTAAFAEALPAVSPPTNWTGLIIAIGAGALIGLAIGGVIWYARSHPGTVAGLTGLLHKQADTHAALVETHAEAVATIPQALAATPPAPVPAPKPIVPDQWRK